MIRLDANYLLYVFISEDNVELKQLPFNVQDTLFYFVFLVADLLK